MAKLGSFKVDSAAIAAGEWVSPGDEYDDLEIRSRGFGDAYADARATRQRKLVRKYGSWDKVPTAEQRELVVETLIDHCTQDVRNLVDDDGKKIDFAQFCGLLRDPGFPDLLAAAINAAAKIGRGKSVEAADAAGN